MIVPMTRVELVCMSSIRPRVIESLQAQGLLHLDEAPLAVEEETGYLDRLQLEGAELQSYTTLEEAERALSEIAPLLTLQPGEHDIRSAATAASKMADDELGRRAKEWAAPLRNVTRERSTRRDAIDVLNNYRGILQQVSPALGGTNIKLGRGTRAIVLQGNVKKVADKLDDRLKSEVGAGCTFHRNLVSRKQLVGLISFPESREGDVSRILGQEGVTPVDMRDQSFENATVAEVIARIDKTIAEHQKELTRLEGEANKVSRQVGAELLGAKLVVADRLSRLRVYGQFARSKMVTVFHGWAPDDQFGALKQAVEREFPGKVEVNRVNAGDTAHHSVPTQLRNAAFFKPFEMILGVFGPLTYGTVDPTWMLGLSFTLFYGFIVGDVVYGAIIVALALWIKGKWGKSEIGNSIGTIAMYMGVSTMVWGFIYGEYLGSFGGEWLWPKLTGHELHPIFHRAHETTMLLVLAIMVGVVLIPLSMILGIREKWKHGHKHHALEQLGLLLGLIALLIFVMGILGVSGFGGPAMNGLALIIGIAGVILLFATMKVMGLIGIIEILSLGGNIMSYARLMALGVAGIALAEMANAMPAMMGYLFGIPFALLIHAANLGLSIASPTIHSLRLNFVEFLPKFYSSEGRDFNPFRKETQW